MFYNVISYCSIYAKEIYDRKNWLPYVTITETSQVKHLGMTATKLTLEWTKVSCKTINIQYMRSSTILCTVKMECEPEINIFVLKMMVKSGLEKIF